LNVASNQRVVVFGGTFDPVTDGHLAIAAQVLSAGGAGELWFLLSNIQPLRPAPHAPAAARLRLLHAAVDGTPGFVVRDDEVARGGTTYTADTMDALHAAQPGTEFLLLLGADAARQINAWHRSAELLARELFVIANRAGVPPLTSDDAVALGYQPARTTLLEVHSPEISASEVRERARSGSSLAGLVPGAVARLIHELGLYGSARPVHNAGG
jgi:nicotinate-nucleotide adenylyltransferase